MLSPREQDVYNYIVSFIRQNGQAPLLTEIAEGLGIKSKGVIHRYITALEYANMIERSGRHRGIRVLDEATQPGCIPLYGSIAAGAPIEAISHQQNLDVAALFTGENCYALQVKGDSMIDEGILDGDWVVIESVSTARSGDIVVALVDGEEVTLKTIEYLPNGQVKLIPANTNMEPMMFNGDQVKIQGLLKGQMRVYR